MNERATSTIDRRHAIDRVRNDTDMITVFVADSHRVAREGLAAYLGLIDDIAVVGEAGDGQDMVNRITAMVRDGKPPHVILISLLMPHMDGVVATRTVKKLWPHIGVIALTSLMELSMVNEALKAGASAYLIKDIVEADDVARLIRLASGVTIDEATL